MIFLKIVLPQDSQVLLLEDSPMRTAWFRKRIPKLTVCATVPEMAAYFEKKPICDFIFLDHDLGEGAGTGEDAANYIHDRFGGNTDAMLIHSWNKSGAARMQSILKGAPAIPFGSFEVEVEKD